MNHNLGHKRRKVLVVTPVSPAPVLSGNSRRVASVLEVFKKLEIDVRLIVLQDPRSFAAKDMDETGLSRLCHSYDVIPIRGWRPGKHRAKARFLYSMRAQVFSRLNKILTYRDFEASNTLFFRVMACLWKIRPQDLLVSKSVKREFEKVVAEFEPDVVWINYIFFSSLLLGLNKNVVRIIDTHDRMTDRNRHLLKQGAGIEQFWLASTKADERRHLRRAERVVAIQEREAAWFKGLVGQRSEVFTVDILDEPVDCGPPPAEGAVVGFITGSSEISLISIGAFIENVWPSVKRLIPQSELRIAGSGSQILKLRYGKRDGICYVGKLDSVTDFYAGLSLVVNPIKVGTGLKIKSVEALIHGRALVAFSEGCEGLLDLEGAADYLVKSSGSWESMLENVVMLLNDPQRLCEMGRLAHQCVANRSSHCRKLMRSIVFD